MATSLATFAPASRSVSTISWGRYALVGLGTVLAAALANALVYVVGDAVVRYDPDFVELGSALGIAVFTMIPATVAVLLYALLLRRAQRPAHTFARISAVVLVLSLIPDLVVIPSEPGASNGQTAVLMVMHLVAASVIVGLLTTLARPGAWPWTADRAA